MAAPDDLLLVLTTFPDREIAERIVTTLVEERLIACGSLISGAHSIYRWKDAIEKADETLGLLKTQRKLWDALSARLSALHPYEVPEIVAVETAAVAETYLAWVRECTG